MIKNRLNTSLALRKRIFLSSDYIPWQPGFELFSTGYQSYIIKPEDELYGLVADCYEISGNDFSAHSVPTIPDGCTDLMFAFGDQGIKAYISAGVKELKYFYFGNIKYLFGVRFCPGATYHIFRESVQAIVHNPVSLEYGVKNSSWLEEKMAETENFAQRVRVLVDYISRNILLLNGKDKIIQYCMKEIYRHRGNISVEELANQLQYSGRYIHNIFADYVGVAPKNVCQIVRQQYAVFLTRQFPHLTLSDIAAQCGYTDINHMNKELKRYIHCSSSKLKGIDIFLRGDLDDCIIFN